MRTQLTRSITLFDGQGPLSPAASRLPQRSQDQPPQAHAERTLNTLLLGLSLTYIAVVFDPLIQQLY